MFAMIDRAIALLTVALACVMYGGRAEAVCLDGRLPLDQEFKQSRLVAQATLMHESPVIDPADPDGVAATRYDFVAKVLFKGKGRKFSVWIDNTSSRIVFERGAEYLIFVQQNGNGSRGFVDACGNSGLAQESASAFEWLRRKGNRSR
jgi:hypothetical protein